MNAVAPLPGANAAVLFVGTPSADGALPGLRLDRAADMTEALALVAAGDYALVLCERARPGGEATAIADLCALQQPPPCVLFCSPRGAGLLLRALGEPRQRGNRAADRQLLLNAVSTLARVIDSRDPFNARHSERVTRLALELGAVARLSGAELEALELAALLHDVGKVGVPARILAAPGSLSDGDWLQVRRHPGLGARMLGRIRAFAGVADAVRHHHERIDGGGYPDRIAGDAIPLLSRIISICDAYEAMTARRAYRGALLEEEARAQIRLGAGAQFDRDLAELFLSAANMDPDGGGRASSREAGPGALRAPV